MLTGLLVPFGDNWPYTATLYLAPYTPYTPYTIHYYLYPTVFFSCLTYLRFRDLVQRQVSIHRTRSEVFSMFHIFDNATSCELPQYALIPVLVWLVTQITLDKSSYYN